MQYTIPDYYKEFTCIADKCEDTCCAGWKIVIDKKSLNKYKHVKGKFRFTMLKSVDWIRGIFRQDKEKRCAFLNDCNLCEMYANLGEKSLCKTCRLYPRHVEEFEDVREITLSVSCPEVARILMEKKKPVRFLTYEKEGEEEEEDENTDNWRESFDVYCDRLREAYESLSNDDEFIAQRQSLHPGIDIRLSLKKAYLDYWSTELGWKKKKSSKSSNIDWKRTFINALDLPSNQVKKARGKVDLKSLTSIRQTNLYSYLEKEAPLILEMPIFPSDEEIEILNRMNRKQLTEIVKKINNDDRLIKFKNSIFETIMEVKKKDYGN